MLILDDDPTQVDLDRDSINLCNNKMALRNQVADVIMRGKLTMFSALQINFSRNLFFRLTDDN